MAARMSKKSAGTHDRVNKRRAAIPIGRPYLIPVRPVGENGRWKPGLKHGVFLYLERGIIVPCGRCPEDVRAICPKFDAESRVCGVGETYAMHMLAWLRSLPWIQESDLPTVIEYLHSEILLWLIDRQLRASGEFEEKMLKLRNATISTKLQIAAALGLTPASRKALGMPLEPSERPIGVREYLTQGGDDDHSKQQSQGPTV
jgi:hypothetical protein